MRKIRKRKANKDRKTKLDNMLRQLSADLKTLCGKIKQNTAVIVLSDDNQIVKLYVEYIKKKKIRDQKMVITKSAQIVTEQVEKALFRCSVQYDNFIIGKA